MLTRNKTTIESTIARFYLTREYLRTLQIKLRFGDIVREKIELVKKGVGGSKGYKQSLKNSCVFY